MIARPRSSEAVWEVLGEVELFPIVERGYASAGVGGILIMRNARGRWIVGVVGKGPNPLKPNVLYRVEGGPLSKPEKDTTMKTTMTITREDLACINSAPAVLVAGLNGPEWVTEYTLYWDRGDTVARYENGTFDKVLCGPEISEQLVGEGPWVVGIAMSGKDVVDLWSPEVDAIVFRGMIISPRAYPL